MTGGVAEAVCLLLVMLPDAQAENTRVRRSAGIHGYLVGVSVFIRMCIFLARYLISCKLDMPYCITSRRMPKDSSDTSHLQQHPAAASRELQHKSAGRYQPEWPMEGKYRWHRSHTPHHRSQGGPNPLYPYTQNPWSNVSPDGRLYAFETTNSGTYPYTYTLFYASLNGGSPTSFASIVDGTQLMLVEWTRM